MFICFIETLKEKPTQHVLMELKLKPQRQLQSVPAAPVAAKRQRCTEWSFRNVTRGEKTLHVYV